MNFFSIVIGCLLTISISTAYADEKIARVKTKENYIRESDRFYSQIKAKVFFEDTLQIIEKKNDWLHVKYQDAEGWIHKSAVIESRKMTYKPVMLGSEIDPEAEKNNDEVTLAGKGFTPDVEKTVKEKNPDLNFAQVDEIVDKEIPPQALNNFIKEGGLKFPK